MVTNFVLVVENFKQLALNLAPLEKPKDFNMSELIVKDFFVSRKRKARAARKLMSEKQLVKKERLSVESPADPELSQGSDKETEESHGKIGKVIFKLT